MGISHRLHCRAGVRLNVARNRGILLMIRDIDGRMAV
jgi:hypothetical protein